MKAAWETMTYYRMAIFYGALFSFNALATAIVASFLNTEWADISYTSRFILVVVVLQNWSGTMLAFLNKTMSRVAENKPPIPTGETELTARDQAKL